MVLSELQREIVETRYAKVVVMAAAAAGKTACISERAKFLLAHGIDPSKLVIITFTNAAADEMAERIGKHDGAFIGTIHSYAYYLLCLAGYKEEADKYINNEKFDKLFLLLRKHPTCIRQVDYLILDEAQDCAEEEWIFLLDMIKPMSYFICGDQKQAIYEWRGADPEYLIDLAKRKDVQFYSLNENYRNGANILAYAKRIIEKLGYDYYDNSICKSGRTGTVVEVEYDINSIPRYIIDAKNYNKWFVLVRTNDEGNEVQDALTRAGIPNDSFKRAGMSGKELNERMKANTVKVLTMHTAKGLEAEYVIAVDPRFWSDEEKRLSYVAATRAKDCLYWMAKPRRRKKVNPMSNWE